MTNGSSKKQNSGKWPTGPDSADSHWAPDVNDWFSEYIKPVYDALWHHDETLAQEKLEFARKAISDGVIKGETAGCFGAQLNYTQYQVKQKVIRTDSDKLPGHEMNASFAKIIQETLVPDRGLQGQESYQYQVRLYIIACFSAAFTPPLLSEEEFSSWMEELEPKYQNTEFWHYVSIWAYLNKHLAPLELAYDYIISQGAGFFSEYSFKQTELMLKILRRVATEDNLLDLIKLSPVKQQLELVKGIFFEQASEQGIWTPELNRFYEDLLIELSHNKESRTDRLIEKGEPPKK